jgi:hypothetical protein
MEAEVRMGGSGFPRSLLLSSTRITEATKGPDNITVQRAIPDVNCLLTQTMATTSEALKCDNVSSFKKGWALIADQSGADLFVISEVQTSSNYLQHTTQTLSRKYQSGSRIVQVKYSQFVIDTSAVTRQPRLLRKESDGTKHIISNNIEDLQLAYVLKNHTETTVPPADPDDLSMIRISIVGRTAKSDPHYAGDGYRRRDMSTRVQLRNFHLRKGI